jgi:hypothetical protein
VIRIVNSRGCDRKRRRSHCYTQSVGAEGRASLRNATGMLVGTLDEPTSVFSRNNAVPNRRANVALTGNPTHSSLSPRNTATKVVGAPGAWQRDSPLRARRNTFHYATNLLSRRSIQASVVEQADE